jgi:hypothetical protein
VGPLTVTVGAVFGEMTWRVNAAPDVSNAEPVLPPVAVTVIE